MQLKSEILTSCEEKVHPYVCHYIYLKIRIRCTKSFLRVTPHTNNWFSLIIAFEVHGTIVAQSKLLPKALKKIVVGAVESGKLIEIIQSTFHKIIYK